MWSRRIQSPYLISHAGSPSGSSDGGGGAGGPSSKFSIDQEELEEQTRVNKIIEKQIKKDKRRFR